MTFQASHPDPHAGALPRWLRAMFSSVRVTDLVLWYALGVVVVHVLPSMLRLGGPPWTLPPGDEIQAWYWAIAFLLAAFGLTVWRVLRGGVSLPWVVGLAAWPWAGCFAVLMLRDGVAHSRLVAIMSAGLGALLLLAPAVMGQRGTRYVSRALSLVVIVAGAMSSVRTVTASRDIPREGSSTVVTTALSPVAIHYERSIVPDPDVPGGALARVGRDLLLVTGAGDWYVIGWDSDNTHLRATRMELPALMNRDIAGFAGPYPPLMRVTGLTADVRGDTSLLWVVHEVWDAAERCIAHQVSAMRLHHLQPVEKTWREVYRTQPCVKFSEGFDPYDSGSRATILQDGSLLLTVGDYGMTRTADSALAQLPDGDYGKTVVIRADGTRTLYSMGHRNPSGITMDREGNVWVTEHGPRGGDELNLLKPGANYGWPFATYGTDYGSFRWRYPASSNDTFSEPAFVFVPSVGISNIIAIEGRLFEQWSGDLLAGTLAAKQLIRIRRTGSRVVYAEPIPLQLRVRDLVETEDGRIVIWNDDGDMVWLSPASDVLEGTMAYEPCIRCHDIIEENGSPLAPRIAGIVGRRVAANPDFEFSEALKRAGGRWTEERLDAFLRSPSEFAPGTTMVFPGIADNATRRALIEFLRKAPPSSRSR